MPIRGPFDSYLQPRQEQEAPQPTGWEHASGGVAHLATAFLSGARRGRIEKFQKEEAQRERQLAAHNAVLEQIAKSNMTDEAKQRFSAPILQGIVSQVAGVDTAPVAKGGHPLGNFLKDTAVHMTGGAMPKRGAPMDHNVVLEALAGMGSHEHSIDYLVDQKQKAAQPRLAEIAKRQAAGEFITRDQILAYPEIQDVLNVTQRYQKQPSYAIKSVLDSASPGPKNAQEWYKMQAAQRLNAGKYQGQTPQTTAPIPTIQAGKEMGTKLVNQDELNDLNIFGAVDKATHNWLDPKTGEIVPGRSVNHPNGRSFNVGYNSAGQPFEIPQHYQLTGNATQPKNIIDRQDAAYFRDTVADKTTGAPLRVIGNYVTNEVKPLGMVPHPETVFNFGGQDGSHSQAFVPTQYNRPPQGVPSPTAMAAPPQATTTPAAPPMNAQTQQIGAPRPGQAPQQQLVTGAAPGAPPQQAAPPPFDPANPISVLVDPPPTGNVPAKRNHVGERLRELAKGVFSGAINRNNLKDYGLTQADEMALGQTLLANKAIMLNDDIDKAMRSYRSADFNITPLIEQFQRVYRPNADKYALRAIGNHMIAINPEAEAIYERMRGHLSSVGPLAGETGKISDPDVVRFANLLVSPKNTPGMNQAAINGFKNLLWEKSTGYAKSIHMQENQAKTLIESLGIPWRGYGNRPETVPINQGQNKSLVPEGFKRPGSGAPPRMGTPAQMLPY